jgi:hypothetical protein
LGVFEGVTLRADLGLFMVGFANRIGGDVRGELWHTWESLRANFKGGKITHFEVDIPMHEMKKHEINWH